MIELFRIFGKLSSNYLQNRIISNHKLKSSNAISESPRTTTESSWIISSHKTIISNHIRIVSNHAQSPLNHPESSKSQNNVELLSNRLKSYRIIPNHRRSNPRANSKTKVFWAFVSPHFPYDNLPRLTTRPEKCSCRGTQCQSAPHLPLPLLYPLYPSLPPLYISPLN